MDKKRIRRAVILLLALLNISLLCLVCWQSLQSRRYGQQLQEQAVGYLAMHGIAAERDDFPWESTLQPRSVIASANRSSLMAAGLLGESLQAETESSVRYSGQNGTLIISGSSFSAMLTGRETDNPQADILHCLKEMGISAVITENRAAMQKIDGLPVFNCLTEGTYYEDSSAKLRGRFVPGETLPDYSRSARDTAGLLVDLAAGLDAMDASCSAVLSVTEGFLLESGDAGAVLTPVWKVETDGGVFLLNAVTGTVSAWDISL